MITIAVPKQSTFTKLPRNLSYIKIDPITTCLYGDGQIHNHTRPNIMLYIKKIIIADNVRKDFRICIFICFFLGIIYFAIYTCISKVCVHKL